jgi:NADH-quinone oxidoreductase subunit G
MADTVKLTIDGKAIEAPAGTLVIEAARHNGIEIPAFCYYEGLALQAACRMCLVEVEMLEFVLTNHPLDCPVCDKGGECELQDMVFRYGAGESRFLERKQHVDEQQWSPVVFYDRPRCILCFRCVRICSEGMGVNALGVVNRGALSEIAPNRGERLECDECGMCIDICPVGALTSGTYRYKTRPWEMEHVGTICTHCSDGCKTTLGVRQNRIVRANNRDRSGINGEFLCLKGRYAADFAGHPERLLSPLAKNAAGSFEAVSWSKALELVAARFNEVKARHGKFGVIGSNHTTNEENYALQQFARAGLGTNNIDHHRTGDVVSLLGALAGRADALASSGDLYTSKAVLIVGADLAQQHPFLAFQVRANWRHHRASLYLVRRGPTREDRYAKKVLTAAPGAELRALEEMRGELAQEPEIVILFGDAVKGEKVRELVAFGDSLGIPVKYVCLVDYSNSRGAQDWGLLPDFGPGYQPVAEPGLDLQQMLAAPDLDALWIVGANPLKGGRVLAASSAFVVVNEMFLTETAQRADIVLPAASTYEKSGTVTSVCGELQRLRKAIEKMGTKPDLEILELVARGMGLELPLAPPASLPAPARNGVAVRPELIHSAGDTLYTSGTLGRYSKMLSAVTEGPGELYRG